MSATHRQHALGVMIVGSPIPLDRAVPAFKYAYQHIPDVRAKVPHWVAMGLRDDTPPPEKHTVYPPSFKAMTIMECWL